MADAGLFIGWSEVIPGREKKALEVFNESLQYYGELQKNGKIESFEVALLDPHGGELAGFILIRGDGEKLAHLRIDREFQRRIIRAQLIVTKVGVVAAVIGNRLTEAMGDYAQEISAVS